MLLATSDPVYPSPPCLILITMPLGCIWVWNSTSNWVSASGLLHLLFLLPGRLVPQMLPSFESLSCHLVVNSPQRLPWPSYLNCHHLSLSNLLPIFHVYLLLSASRSEFKHHEDKILSVLFTAVFPVLRTVTGTRQIFNINLLNKWKDRRVCILTCFENHKVGRQFKRWGWISFAFSIPCPCCCYDIPFFFSHQPASWWTSFTGLWFPFTNFLSPAFHLISNLLWNLIVSLLLLNLWCQLVPCNSITESTSTLWTTEPFWEVQLSNG